MMKVYRLEDIEGTGYYTSPVKPVKTTIFTDPKNHPLPIYDGIELSKFWNNTLNNVKNNYYFGFKSIVQYIDWFHIYRDALSMHGFILSVYSIHKNYIRFGEKQLVFRKDRSKLVEKLNCETFERI